MKIAGAGTAGTAESGDVLVVVEPSEQGIRIEMTGPSVSGFGTEIEDAVRGTLAALGVDAASVRLSEKGALDCTIRARLIAACGRAAAEENETAPGIPWEVLP